MSERRLRLKFVRDPVYSGTIFRELQVFPDRFSLTPVGSKALTRRATVEVMHYVVRNKDGHPDLRYRPTRAAWSLGEFISLLQSAVKAGAWGEAERRTASEQESSLFTIDPLPLKAIQIRGGGVYLNVWSHHPLYLWKKNYPSLCHAVDQLVSVRKELLQHWKREGPAIRSAQRG